MKTEVKVGLVVLIGVVILFYMSFKVGTFGKLTRGGYDVVVNLDNSSGLDSKSPVQIAGVDVGKVRRISLDGYRARLILLIRDNVKIPKDSKLSVRAFGILGERYLAILPGASKEFLKDKEEIKDVVGGAEVEELATNVSSAAKNFSDVMGQLKEVLGDNEKEALKTSISNIKTASGEFKDMVASNKVGVQKIVTNMASVSEKIGPIAEKADSTFTGLQTIVNNVEQGKGTLGLLVKDETLYQDAKQTVASLKSITTDIEQGKGTLGKLAKDEALGNDLQATMKSVREISDAINKGEGTLGKLVKDDTLAKETEKTLKKVQKAAEGIQEQTPISVLGTIFGFFF
jgi:phospholipid/cholesterol/gamma-HCH transport system substrate-binding protein